MPARCLSRWNSHWGEFWFCCCQFYVFTALILGFVFFKKGICRSKLCLLHTDQALPVQLPVVGNSVQPSVTVISCHFLGFLEKHRTVCAPSASFSCRLMFKKYHSIINLLPCCPPPSFSVKHFWLCPLCFFCRLRVFDSGVMVVQLQSHSEEEMIASALDNVSRTNAALTQMWTWADSEACYFKCMCKICVCMEYFCVVPHLPRLVRRCLKKALWLQRSLQSSWVSLFFCPKSGELACQFLTQSTICYTKDSFHYFSVIYSTLLVSGQPKTQ